ncbi:IS66 family transposase [Leptothoe sp. PORK10 BA2]|uniref:IS66 family transposase n=1 Tax=Leptothoe sp. PORK10 BA2 TaxID=3110254 RepID=UPI002B220E2A|nr:IS66 family transposase [Leptothoe sp. PORK10 BA2]MEA5464902.1 IS66 family transposase [Leptothoe sp. PORK10 BA2]
MNEEIEIAGIKVPKADWDATPPSIQALVLVLSERLDHQSERLSQLEEKLNKNSKNSSKPPSTDGFGKTVAEKKRSKKPKNRRPSVTGSRQVRKLQASEDCDRVEEVMPTVCAECGSALHGLDSHPHRHQVIELPPIEPMVVEYRLHQLSCEGCGHLSRAELPIGVSASGYGERLSAIVSLLSGPYRQSYRQVCSLMADLFGVSLSRGSVGRLREEVSASVSAPVNEAKRYVQAQPVVHSDETSMPQGNRDGRNPQGRKGWLWVLVSPLVSFFEVVFSRSQASAKALIGESFSGIVNSDRHSAYGWISLENWQVCWAHLKRDLTAIAQRTGVSQEIGEALLRREGRLFRWWHRVRDGTLSRQQFMAQVEYLRRGFKAVLAEAASLPIAADEKTPLAKTVRTCRRFLKVESALWTFVSTPGVEPTNNAAERALRPAVIWRKTSFGTQSQKGTLFVTRMLTVTASLKAQGRNILDFLTQACLAARMGQAPPSLIPQPTLTDKSLPEGDIPV